MAALLGIVANAMFLDTYGSAWLPVTYIAIGVAGIVVSGAIARTAQRLRPHAHRGRGARSAPPPGSPPPGCVAVGVGAAWVSAPLLVLFPILIQLGFVFVGGQGGRLLDIAGIKASFPRIMAGFPVGRRCRWRARRAAGLPGSAGPRTCCWRPRSPKPTFAALVWATGRRYATQLARPSPAPRPVAQTGAGRRRARPSLVQRLLAAASWRSIVAYQVLSALASQLADYLVFDRAIAQYPDPADLARFLAVYTAVMNVVSIAFLFAVAGPLLRRFGLRLGITANPLVVTIFAVGMVVAFASSGGASLALLAIVSAARIADIALTDGTTRTSINATYQVLPERSACRSRPRSKGSACRSRSGSRACSSSCSTLSRSLSPRRSPSPRSCARSGPGRRSARTGPTGRRSSIHFAADRSWSRRPTWRRRRGTRPSRDRCSESGPAHGAARDRPVDHDVLAGPVDRTGRACRRPAPEVRLSALAALAASGDEGARRRLAGEVRASATATDPAIRLRAARALAALDPDERAAAAALLVDDDPAVRSAALDSVQAGDLFAVEPVIAALDDPATFGPAQVRSSGSGTRSCRRWPSCSMPPDRRRRPLVLRLVPGRHHEHARARRGPSSTRRTSRSRARTHRRGAARRAGPASDAIAAALDDVLTEDAHHAARILTALVALEGAADPLGRALEEELDLVPRRSHGRSTGAFRQ